MGTKYTSPGHSVSVTSYAGPERSSTGSRLRVLIEAERDRSGKRDARQLLDLSFAELLELDLLIARVIRRESQEDDE